MMNRSDISEEEYSDYDAYYLNLVPEGELIASLRHAGQATAAFFRNLPTPLHNYRYAPGKWTPKQVLQHIIDVERVFAYRMLRYARADATYLPGFDQEQYGNAYLTDRSMEDLIEEYQLCRRSTEIMLAGLSETELRRRGTASNLTASVRALGFKLVGHDLHHCLIVQDRYVHARE